MNFKVFDFTKKTKNSNMEMLTVNFEWGLQLRKYQCAFDEDCRDS